MLYGERLGEWEVAAEVAAGILRIPCNALNPLVRIEAHRLLGRSHVSLGRPQAAFRDGESAVAIATEVGFVRMDGAACDSGHAPLGAGFVDDA